MQRNTLTPADEASDRLMNMINIDREEEEVIEEIEGSELNLDYVGQRGYTLLEIALEKGRFKIAKLLIEKGANVNTVNRAGYTPLINAIYTSNCDDESLAIVKLLISKGADVNHIDRENHSVLTHAHRMRRGDIVKVLEENGARVNHDGERDNESIRFIRSIASCNPYERNEKKIIESMKEKEFNLDYIDSEGNSLLYHAIYNRMMDIAKFLIERGAKVDNDMYGNKLFYYAIKLNNMDIVNLLIEKGADVNHIDGSGFGGTPLIRAIESGEPGIVRLLIDKDADVNCCGKFGQKPLSVAAKSGDPDIVKLLIKNGADVNHTDRHGNTALDIARTNGYDSIVDTLNSAIVFTRSDGYLPSGAGAGAGAGAGEADKAEVDAKTSGRCVIS